MELWLWIDFPLCCGLPRKITKQKRTNKFFDTHTLIRKCIVHQNTLHGFQGVGIRDRSCREQVPFTTILFCLLRIPACKMKRSHRLGWVRSVGSSHGALCKFAQVKKHATSHNPHCGMEWTKRRYNSEIWKPQLMFNDVRESEPWNFRGPLFKKIINIRWGKWLELTYDNHEIVEN